MKLFVIIETMKDVDKVDNNLEGVDTDEQSSPHGGECKADIVALEIICGIGSNSAW